MQWAASRKSGFTIVELLIVIVVIAILAAITIVAYGSVQSRARDSIRASDIRSIKIALEMYRTEVGSYPDACGGVNGCSATNLAALLVPTYTNSIPVDMDATRTYTYVRDSADGYGLRVHYENSPGLCKTGINIKSNWWGGNVTTPVCPG